MVGLINKNTKFKQIEALLASELDVSCSVKVVMQRENRCVVILEESMMAVFASNQAGIVSMQRERDILIALAGKTSFKVPRSYSVNDEGSLELRQMVTGDVIQGRDLEAILSDQTSTRQLALNIGEVLAELHTCLHVDVVNKLTLSPHSWPESADWIRQRLPDVVTDKGFLGELLSHVDAFDNLLVDGDDRVLCHGDLGFHNIAFEPGSLKINGLFDFDSATLSDRNWDLRYLIFGAHESDYNNLKYAMERYTATSSYQLNLDRILLYNAISAITYLAFRKGIEKHVKWCGRTFDEDIGWTKTALAKLN